MTENKEWYKNWKSSADKWIRAVEKVKNGQEFVNMSGFGGLDIVARCGYCNEYSNEGSCKLCHLFQTRVRWRRICNESNYPSGVLKLDSYLYRFVKIMKKSSPNLKKALEHAEIILRIILADCPNRAQAKQDGIEFIVHGVFIPVEYMR